MGIVYQARQLGLNRIVALKMILTVPLTGRQLRERFRVEAEAMARLQHPHIVQVYEVGEQDGRPWLALEYVGGGTLARRLQGEPQPATAVAGLVETLARAMHHAHGIIHRDLKPGNILLASGGCQPPDASRSPRPSQPLGDPHPPLAEIVPKIGDFGLAKHLASPGGEAGNELTETGAVLGTPSYMAPEQASGQGKEVGPAADIWALGILLYEMLIGRVPFRGASAFDTIGLIRTQEPVPPRRLRPQVPRDLETICLKCLRKEPAHRYASAEALADDLRRFLDGRPIHARPVSAWERGWKWARREPRLADLLALGAVAALAVLIAGLEYNARLRVAVARAEKQQARADAHDQIAVQAVDQMLTQVGEKRLEDVPEMEDVRRQLLEQALTFYQRLHDGLDDPDPAVRWEVARALVRTAGIHNLLGDRRRAEADCRRAIAVLDALMGDFPAEPRYALDAADARITLGAVLVEEMLGREAEAETVLRRALDALAPYADRPEVREKRALAFDQLGGACERRPADAEGHYRQALDLRGQIVRERPDDRDARNALAQTHLNLGKLYQETGRAEAAAAYGEARAAWGPCTGSGRAPASTAAAWPTP